MIDDRPTQFWVGPRTLVFLAGGSLDLAPFMAFETLFNIAGRACQLNPIQRWETMAALNRARHNARRS
jgi:hypothetical protein